MIAENIMQEESTGQTIQTDASHSNSEEPVAFLVNTCTAWGTLIIFFVVDFLRLIFLILFCSIIQANNQLISQLRQTSMKPKSVISLETIKFAILKIKEFIDFQENNDLDKTDGPKISHDQWSKFYESFYAACQYLRKNY
jgi:hypothetical protein